MFIFSALKIVLNYHNLCVSEIQLLQKFKEYQIMKIDIRFKNVFNFSYIP